MSVELFRFVSSEDPLAPFDNATLEDLKVALPLSSQLLYSSPTHLVDVTSCVQVTADQVCKAILSVKCESSGGPDGLHP